MIYKQPSIYKMGTDSGGNLITTPGDFYRYIENLEDITSLCVFSSKLVYNTFKIAKDESYIYILGTGLAEQKLDNFDHLILLPNNYKLKSRFCFNSYCPQQNRPISQGWLLDYSIPAAIERTQPNEIHIGAYSFNGYQQYGYGISISSPFQFEYELL